MKLAEALILRADAQKRIEQLKGRLVRNAMVQEGDDPAEQPAELVLELERVADDLTRLIQRINRTNAALVLDEGRSMSDALAERDVLGLRFAVYRELAQAASVDHARYSRSEVKFRGTVNVAEMQRRADDLARGRRELDARIQSMNWTAELGE